MAVGRENIELVLRGYRAFVAGDMTALSSLLDPDVEWYGIDRGAWDCADRENVLAVLAERFAEGYRIELQDCVAVGDQVVVNFRASGTEKVDDDVNPLRTRRFYTVGYYSGVVTIRDGRVVQVQDFPDKSAALEAVGLTTDH